METSGSPRTVPLDLDGHIAADVLCLQCGYNLRGLRVQQGCPECSTPVAFSLRGDLLRFRDPRWVAKLARGTAWMLAGFGGYLVMGNIGYPLAMALGQTGGLIMLLGMLALAFAGVWLVTAPDPGRPAGRGQTDARRLVRILLVTALWLVPLVALTAGISSKLMLVPGILAFVSLFGGMGMLLVYMRQIARKVPAPRLARHATILLWVFAAAAGMKLIADIAHTLWPSTKVVVGPGATTAARAIGAMRDLGNLLILVYFVWFIVLLIGYVRVLRREARESQMNWIAGPAEPTTARIAPPQREENTHGNL